MAVEDDGSVIAEVYMVSGIRRHVQFSRTRIIFFLADQTGHSRLALTG